MLPLSLFRNPVFRRTNLLTFLLYGALAPLFYYLPLKLIQTEGYTPRQAGAAMLPLVLTLSLVSQFTAPLTRKFGPGALIALGPAAVGAGTAMIAFCSAGTGYWTSLAPGLFLVGAGLACTVAPLTSLVMASAQSGSSGVASGVNNTMAQVAALLALAASTPLFLHIFAKALHRYLFNFGANHAADLIWAQRGSLGAIVTTSASGTTKNMQRAKGADREGSAFPLFSAFERMSRWLTRLHQNKDNEFVNSETRCSLSQPNPIPSTKFKPLSPVGSETAAKERNLRGFSRGKPTTQRSTFGYADSTTTSRWS